MKRIVSCRSVAANHPRWTPLHIELMLHYCASNVRHPRAHAPAVADCTKELQKHGLIELTPDESPVDYAATEKGKAFLELICQTPLPVRAWMHPDGTVIRKEEV